MEPLACLFHALAPRLLPCGGFKFKGFFDTVTATGSLVLGDAQKD